MNTDQNLSLICVYPFISVSFVDVFCAAVRPEPLLRSVLEQVVRNEQGNRGTPPVANCEAEQIERTCTNLE